MSEPAREVKRPWGHKTLLEHWARLPGLLADRPPRRILDVGFGRLKRSTRALARLFPESEILAIDNDVRLVNEEGGALQDGGAARLVFGDADAWLPSQAFDLVTVCMTAHAFSHPFRAVANLVDSCLAPGGHLVFVHRVDDVMRAAVRIIEPDAGVGSEAKAIAELWAKLGATELPWGSRLVCEHAPLAYLCRGQGLSTRDDWDWTTERPRESNETLQDVFGTPKQEPQYEAPRRAWERRSKRAWPQPEATVLRTDIALRTVMYQTDGAGGVVHAVPFIDHSPAVPILDVALGPEVSPDSESFGDRIHELVYVHLPDVAAQIHGCYYIDERQTRRLWGPDPAMTEGRENTFTRAVAASPLSCPGKSGNPPLLVAGFPCVEEPDRALTEMQMPARCARTVGASDKQVVLVPLARDPDAIRNALKRLGLLDPPLRYLVARGNWARETAGPGASLFVFLFHSPALDPSGSLTAMTFLSKRWLAPEAIRVLVDIGHTVLSRFEDRQAARSRAAVEAFGAVDHAFANLRATLRAIDDFARAKAVFATAYYFIRSARIFFEDRGDDGAAMPGQRPTVEAWDVAGTEIRPGERLNFGECLSRAFTSQRPDGFHLEVRDAAVRGEEIDCRILGILFELAHNMQKHTIKRGRRDGLIEIRVSRQDATPLAEIVATCQPVDGTDLPVRPFVADRLADVAGKRWSGVRCIAEYVRQLAVERAPDALVELASLWSDRRLDGRADGFGEVTFRSPRLYLRGPARGRMA